MIGYFHISSQRGRVPMQVRVKRSVSEGSVEGAGPIQMKMWSSLGWCFVSTLENITKLLGRLQTKLVTANSNLLPGRYIDQTRPKKMTSRHQEVFKIFNYLARLWTKSGTSISNLPHAHTYIERSHIISYPRGVWDAVWISCKAPHQTQSYHLC